MSPIHVLKFQAEMFALPSCLLARFMGADVLVHPLWIFLSWCDWKHAGHGEPVRLG